MAGVVAVVQARMGSTRLPGKVLANIGYRPLALWTGAAATAVAGVEHVVVATTTEAADDPLAALMEARGVPVHRGPVQDVLTRVQDAAVAFEPELVVRATADNPFMDPAIVSAQVGRCREGGFDYVGPAGWPLGIAAEVAASSALEAACREATDPAEREHVMPFIYNRPERFRIGNLPHTGGVPDARFTIDTMEDLAFARAVVARLGSSGAVSLADLARVLEAEPELADINRDVRQKGWHEVERA